MRQIGSAKILSYKKPSIITVSTCLGDHPGTHQKCVFLKVQFFSVLDDHKCCLWFCSMRWNCDQDSVKVRCVSYQHGQILASFLLPNGGQDKTH